MSLRILSSESTLRTRVDPFDQLPCEHQEILVHTTNGDSLGDDLVQCVSCDFVITLRDLYAAVRMPPGTLPS